MTATHVGALTLKEFRRTATQPQIEILEKIIASGKMEGDFQGSVDHLSYLERYRPGRLTESLMYANNWRELSSDLLEEQERLRKVRARIGRYLKQAVAAGMGNVGFIQRHYESYTGEELRILDEEAD